MTSPDLKAAAERWLKKRSGTNPYLHTSGPQALIDAALLADAYTDLHPADDAEPVTAEWWVESGGTYDDRSYAGTLIHGPYTRIVRSPAATILVIGTGVKRIDVALPHVKPRGDVRRLCTALGIELNEGAIR